MICINVHSYETPLEPCHHVRNFCHVSTTSLIIPSECGTLIYPIISHSKNSGTVSRSTASKAMARIARVHQGKQKHHEATGSCKETTDSSGAESKSMDSTAAAYLKILNPRRLLLSSFICFSCQGQLWLNTWHSTRRPSLRLFLSSGSIQLRLCYNESDNMLQSCQIRQVEPPIWCHLISLYRYTAYSLRFLCRPFDIHDILCNYPLGVPRQELWADLAECRPKIWQVVQLLVLFVFGVATCVLGNSFTAQSLKFPDSFHKAIGCVVAKCWFIFILPSKSSSWNGACVIRRLIFIWIKVREA